MLGAALLLGSMLTCSLLKGHFRCEHTYPPMPGTYTATVRVQDEDGGHTTHNLRIQVP